MLVAAQCVAVLCSFVCVVPFVAHCIVELFWVNDVCSPSDIIFILCEKEYTVFSDFGQDMVSVGRLTEEIQSVLSCGQTM